MRIALLSDIHANVTALEAILADISKAGADAYALVGDLVNYGPRPNETIDIIRTIPDSKIVANIWGNHEYSVFGGSLDRFATDRGRSVLQYTNSILSDSSREYIDRNMDHKGFTECRIDNLEFLFMHGNPDDPYWGKFGIGSMDDQRFKGYDYVVSGHSHVPHYVEHFFDADNAQYRNRKRTVFINPGSVGQPRNHNPLAQYGILDTRTGAYEHRSVLYDVKKEQQLFPDSVDIFYKNRLALGI